MSKSLAKGSDAIKVLAARFPQLYIAPAEDTQDAFRAASGRGIVPEGANLDHFLTNPEDELREVDSPAGPVEVVFLKERADFETFLQIIGHRAQSVPIARTVGAITYRGIADWGTVRAAYERYVAGGGDDWGAEFSRLAQQPGMFRAELVVISEGPYSNIAADQTPYSAEEWVPISREIRLHHECAHVVCRRTMPDNIAEVWDEVTADVVGLLCATGHYDAQLAAHFLGVTADGFCGGRLIEYLSDEQKERLDEVSREVYASLVKIEQTCTEDDCARPFDYLLRLKNDPFLTY
ncbi:MAG: hypothetical protein IJ781_08565 [Atopobiaceae bacterium]|nr:hypothetical protein [Atopobiaceae bacterium]